MPWNCAAAAGRNANGQHSGRVEPRFQRRSGRDLIAGSPRIHAALNAHPTSISFVQVPMNTQLMKRRQFIQGATLLRRRRAADDAAHLRRIGGDSRLIVIIMRGAVDGLAAVPPYGDPNYARLRGSLAIAAPGATDGALRLDNLFGLHPQMTFCRSRSWAENLRSSTRWRRVP